MAPKRLLNLPAELRNNIHELAFTPEDETVDFRRPQPPSKSLILACRQTYNEAAQIYREAYRKYWTDSYFVITNANDSNFKWDPKNLIHIQNLEITRFRYHTSRRFSATALRLRGGWNLKLIYNDLRGHSVQSFQGTSAQSPDTFLPYTSADELEKAAERGDVLSQLDGPELWSILRFFN